jgi:hypothetical protein
MSDVENCGLLTYLKNSFGNVNIYRISLRPARATHIGSLNLTLKFVDYRKLSLEYTTKLRDMTGG